MRKNLVRLCHSCYVGLRKLEVRGETEFLLVKGNAGGILFSSYIFEMRSLIAPCLRLRRLFIFFVSHLLYVWNIGIRHVIEGLMIKPKRFAAYKLPDH